MIYRIIDLTTKIFLRDGSSFDEKTEIGIVSKTAPKFGKFSKWNGTKWIDTKTSEDLAEIERLKTLATEKAKAQQFITDFDYVENKIIREQQLYGKNILDTKSSKVDLTYREILAKKEEYIKLVN